ncbi:hypothetical protein [Sphingomonas oleivorans]|uniref:hypothetical protein n=1 Tax=Sphingomonas oleivorans TaxID=1735121 RepID=UPI001FB019AD|nr:hypothetical protein [Sphingomonas oleivorans]
MKYRLVVAVAALFMLSAADMPKDSATVFGVREGAAQVSLSPDGSKIAFIAPAAGQGAALYTVGVEEGARPRRVLVASGAPERLDRCNWVANDRLVCTVYGVIYNNVEPLPFTRVVAVDADGANQKLLSNRTNFYTRISIHAG